MQYKVNTNIVKVGTRLLKSQGILILGTAMLLFKSNIYKYYIY